jgi:hypothetical protein
MKILHFRNIAVFAASLILPFIIQAQQEPSPFWKGWSINVNGGASLFYGDVENYDFYKVTENNNEWRLGYGLMLQKQFNPLFTLRGQFFYGELSGTKRKSNIWFEGDVIETSLSGKLDFINLFFETRERKLSLYGMLGLGIAQWRTKLMDFRTDEQIGGNGNFGSGFDGRTLEPVIPVGFGIDYNIGKRWGVNAEISWRPVNSDKLDATEGGSKYDLYSYNFVGVTYKFIKREKKPPIVLPAEIAEAEEPEEKPVETRAEEPPAPIVVKEVPPKQKTLDEKLLDAEKRTGLYESPWPGVEFTVQIAASKRINDPLYFKNKFGLSGDVQMHSGQGWYRFSIGKYIKYWQAREYRNILVTRNNINGAFVVAYRDGERIMLSELIAADASKAETSGPVQPARPSFTRAFSVQVLASKSGSITPGAIREMYEIDLEVFKEYNPADGTFQYSVGNFESYQEAAKVRNKLKARGIRGAFVVGYKDGVRVSDIKSILD